METNELFPTTELLKISPSCEANPLTDKTVNSPPSLPTRSQMDCNRKMTNELCLAGLMGIIMLMDVYGAVWEVHVVFKKCWCSG